MQQRGKGGLAFFFDYAAAFPSIERRILMTFFKHLGWPRWLLTFIEAICANTYCDISLGGRGSEASG